MPKPWDVVLANVKFGKNGQHRKTSMAAGIISRVIQHGCTECMDLCTAWPAMECAVHCHGYKTHRCSAGPLIGICSSGTALLRCHGPLPLQVALPCSVRSKGCPSSLQRRAHLPQLRPLYSAHLTVSWTLQGPATLQWRG
mmetsp:Transcript_14102/g.19038  ORF Transcript_14102/g.19038 Transcript_14102/m.19038 type:complete len:140 (-) Transcript_14102:24-443(-)